MLSGAASIRWGQRWKPGMMRELLFDEALLPRWMEPPALVPTPLNEVEGGEN